MPSRDLLLKILGDSSSAEHALSSTGDHAQKLGGHFGGLAKMAAFAAGGAGVGLVVEGLKGAIGAAQESEAAHVRLTDSLGKVGVSYKTHGAAIDDAIQKTSNLAALDDEDLSDAFSKLVRTSGNVDQSLQGMNLAADISRARHISLEAATKIVEKGMEGNATAFKKVGLELDKNSTSTEILRAAQERFSGSAEAYGKTSAGAQDRLKVSFENLQETVGQKVLPVLATLFEKLNQGVTFIELHWPQISAVFDKVANEVESAWVNVGRPVFNAVITLSEKVIGFVQDNWPEISQTVRRVFNTVKDIIDTTTDVVRGIWDRFGGDIVKIIKTDIGTVEDVFRGVFQTIKGVVNLIDDLIHGRWKEIWGDLEQIVSGAVGAAVAVIKGAVSNMFTVAKALGGAFLDGIEAGLSALGGALERLIKIPINAVINAFNSLGVPSFHIHFKLPGPIPDINFDTPSLSLPDIPTLATGGYVGRTGLAVVHEGETYSGVGRTLGGGLTVHLNGPIYGGNPRRVGEELADAIHAALLRKQQTYALGFKAS